jgi:anti-sigma-K factor RskA
VTGPDRTTRRPGCGSDAAPYVLGALDPAEAREFADHMRSCAACRDEVAALVPVVDVLPASAPTYEVSAAVRRRVMHAVRSDPKASSVATRRPWLRRRHRTARRRAVAAPALVVTLAIVIAAGGAIKLGAAGSPARVIHASVGHAQLRIAGGGVELLVDHLPPAPPDRVYELWLQHGPRAPAPSTLFAVTSRGTAVLGVPGDFSGITRVLVTVEPSGGSRVPTTRAVIVVRV